MPNDNPLTSQCAAGDHFHCQVGDIGVEPVCSCKCHETPLPLDWRNPQPELEAMMGLVTNFGGPPPTGCGRCGTPDAACDMDCMEAAHYAELLLKIRAALRLVYEERDRLRSALQEYGRHTSECVRSDPAALSYECTCGLAAALRET